MTPIDTADRSAKPRRPVRTLVLAAVTVVMLVPMAVLAGAQREEHLAPSVVAGLAKSIADAPIPTIGKRLGSVPDLEGAFLARRDTALGTVSCNVFRVLMIRFRICAAAIGRDHTRRLPRIGYPKPFGIKQVSRWRQPPDSLFSGSGDGRLPALLHDFLCPPT